MALGHVEERVSTGPHGAGFRENGRMSRTSTHIFRVRLRPRVHREIEIPSETSLHDLAAAIVRAFDFDLDHAFGFFSKLGDHVFDSPVRYELFADLEEGSESGSVKRTTVARAFPDVGAKMQFLFDYGDDWRFQVEVIGLGEKVPKARYPKLLKAAGKAPPQYPPEDDDET
jgi:Plasmid pRiA4b ORF-3-like protein